MTRVDALCLLSTGHLLRILIPLEEPPHLTADIPLSKTYDIMYDHSAANNPGSPKHPPRILEILKAKLTSSYSAT